MAFNDNQHSLPKTDNFFIIIKKYYKKATTINVIFHLNFSRSMKCDFIAFSCKKILTLLIPYHVNKKSNYEIIKKNIHSKCVGQLDLQHRKGDH